MGFIIELSLYADVCLEELWENSLSELVCITDAEMTSIESDC